MAVIGITVHRYNLTFFVYSRTTAGVTEHNVPKWNWSKTRVTSQLQKKKLRALALMATMKTVLQNHLYEFDGQLYIQTEGRRPNWREHHSDSCSQYKEETLYVPGQG